VSNSDTYKTTMGRNRAVRAEATTVTSALALFTSEAAASPYDLYGQLRDLGTASLRTGDEVIVLISRYEDVHYALKHPQLFSSAQDSIDLGTPRSLIPLQVDPPNHARYRRLLDPLFGPKAVDAMESDVRLLARGFLKSLVDRGSCDFHAEFAVPFPCTIFLQLMGLPLDDLDRFLAWKDAIIRPKTEDPYDVETIKDVRNEAGAAIDAYFERAIDQRVLNPGKDLLTYFLTAEVEGDRLSRDEVLGMSYLFLLGGLDTVTASLDCMMARIATHPGERRRLVEDPSLIPSAVEELLRFETPVTMVPRVVTSATEIGDRHLEAGTRVMLVLGAANTDDQVFDHAYAVDFHRARNRHFAFSGGPHRCLGSHLARRELVVALEEWHQVIPNYEIAPGANISYSPGIRQIEPLPLVFGSPK
jgi:cytochrome P450